MLKQLKEEVQEFLSCLLPGLTGSSSIVCCGPAEPIRSTISSGLYVMELNVGV